MTTIQTACQIIAIPVLIVLYLAVAVPLGTRQLSHRCVVALDWAFDALAELVGFDPRFWPLPKGQDKELPPDTTP